MSKTLNQEISEQMARRAFRAVAALCAECEQRPKLDNDCPFCRRCLNRIIKENKKG